MLWECYQSNEPFFQVDEIRYIYNEKERLLQNPLIYVTSGDYSTLYPASLFCFVIDSDSLAEDIMIPEMNGQGFLTIRDTQTGKELVRYGNVPDSEIEYIDGQEVSGESVQGKDYKVIVSHEEELRWKITMGIPLSYIKQQMKPVDRILLAYFLIGLILVIGLTLYYSLRRYTGMKKVLHALPAGKMTGLGKRGFDEYNLLTDNILELEDTGNRYRLRVDELEKENQAIMLEHLIVTGIRTPEERAVFESCFDREPEFFCVAVVRIYQKDYREFGKVTLHLTEFMRKCYEKGFTHVYSGACDELFLFELDMLQEANTDEIKDVFQEAVSALSVIYDVVFHIGISAIGTDFSNINRCYEQASQIVKAQFASQNENVVKAYDISANALFDNPVNLEFLNRLYTLLLCGQQEEILTELERMGGYYERMPYIYEFHKEQIFYSIWNIIYTAGLHLGSENAAISETPAFSRDMTASEMNCIFKEHTLRICDYMMRSKKSRNDELKLKIMEYLRTHFENPGLSAAIASSTVGISEKYLSQFLKEQTGETFSSFLLTLRMDKAKEYLERTDFSNDEIARRTGFGSANTFYRNFNRQMGVSPKVYRENLENKNR